MVVTDGKAFDQRLGALARTTCDRDPRTLDQRRAAAVGALGFGWDRLPCLCEQPACEVASKPAGGGVVIHVIAHTDCLETSSALIHPGQAPPEPCYRPSKKLAEFVRCRDLTCRFPGCTKPATITDIDHTIPWPFGPTCASNLKCLCREHHLLKTFWPGWHDQQSPDGTVRWTHPDGQTSTTHPGSRLLFPELCTPTAEFATTGTPPAEHTTGLTMPRRKTTRAQDRRQRINHERRPNTPANNA